MASDKDNIVFELKPLIIKGKTYTPPLSPSDAIDVTLHYSKVQSRESLIKGLKRYRKDTSIHSLKEELKNLPYK